MIRAVIRNGSIQPVDVVPAEWSEGQELLVTEAECAETADDRWLEELEAAAAQIPEHVHEEMRAALEAADRESKEMVRREFEQSR